MATSMIALLSLALVPASLAVQGPSPIEQVVTMLSDLASKVIGEGEDSHKTFSEFSEWCEDRSKDLQFEIKTGNAESAELNAAIDQENARQGELNAKIEELSGEIATDEADLKASTEIRDKEYKTFTAEEAELVDIVSMLDRAVGILTKEMQKTNADYRSGATGLLQLKTAGSVTEALRIMVEASMISSEDGSKLTALVQSNQGSDDEDSDVNAPAATVYAGHSDNIIDTLENLHEKAESQLSTVRKTETKNVNNFQMLKQSLEDEIKFGNKDMDKAKKELAESNEKEASDKGDLAVTTKELKADTKALADLHHLCMTKASDFEAEQKSREDELKAIAEAKKVILETTSGAASQQYGLNQVAFFQKSAISSRTDLANFEAVRFVRDLARKTNAPALTQLASRMAYAMRFSSGNGDDPFAKIKGLISDMIDKLEAQAEADATEKAYCDKEIAETQTKRSDKNSEIDKLSTAIDQKSARSEKLKEQVTTLQKELADLAASQSEMDKIRAEENKAYVSNKAEMELGLSGVKKALQILRDYYASDHSHNAAEGAGAGILGLLEVVESDFSKTLAEMIATEETAQSDYDAETKENEIDRTTKEQDVKYKTKEFMDLDKAVAELSSDRNGVQAELDAVMEYLRSLDARCQGTLGTSEFGLAKAESYSDRKARRESEIAGLKEALTILEGEASTVLLQHKSQRALRGLKASRTCSADVVSPTSYPLAETTPTHMIPQGGSVKFCGAGQLKRTMGSCPDAAAFDSANGDLFSNGGASECQTVDCTGSHTYCCVGFKCGSSGSAWAR